MFKDDLGPGVWRTVGGRRIFIKDGQDLETAMYESGKFDSIIRKNAKCKKPHKTIHLAKQKYAVFMHEVNTYYDMKNETRPILCKGIGDYFYVFDNYGFNNYNVFIRSKIVGNEFENNIYRRWTDDENRR